MARRIASDGGLNAAEAAALLAPLRGRSRVLLAVSGGADSTALLVLAAGQVDPRRLAVATVDHNLRPESASEARAVAALSSRLGLSHAALSAPPPGRASGVEEQARGLRYALLFEHARAVGADAVATAHTLEDQAETVLMRLAAGSGPAGLAAMRPATMRDGIALLRPFLAVPKARLVATLRERGVGWSEDAMNADAAFARPRLRASRAAMAREGLTPARLATLAERAARAEEALAGALESALGECVAAPGCTIIPASLSGRPAEIRLRLLGRIVARHGGGPVRLERLERLFGRILSEPSGAATLAGARVEWSADGRVVASPAPPRRAAGPPASRRRPGDGAGAAEPL